MGQREDCIHISPVPSRFPTNGLNVDGPSRAGTEFWRLATGMPVTVRQFLYSFYTLVVPLVVPNDSAHLRAQKPHGFGVRMSHLAVWDL